MRYDYTTMLDIKFIVENKDIIKLGAKKKHLTVDVDRLVELDAKRRELKPDDAAFADIIKEWRMLMLEVPNIPDMSVPEGESETDNKEVRRWSKNDPEDGEPQKVSFAAKGHRELMTALGMLDAERGAKVSGADASFLKRDGVVMANAVQFYAQQFFIRRGSEPMMTPVLLRREPFFGTGTLPQHEEELYKTQDGEYLATTPEAATMGYHMNELLDKAELPKRYLSFSHGFHRGADDHEALTLQQVVLCEASHQTSVEEHDALTQHIEEFIQSLGIAYRVVVSCGADLGLGQVKKLAIEVWMPSAKQYRKISTVSYFHDFQTRRLNIRYRDEKGVIRFAHSVSAIAFSLVPMIEAVVENFQREDGSILVPEVLRGFLGKDVIEKNN